MDTSGFEKTVKRNKLLSMTGSVFSAVATMTATGTLMQTFLATLGLPANAIYIHATLTQAVNILVLLLSSGWVRRDKVIRYSARSALIYGLLFLGVIPFCLIQRATVETFLWLVVIGALQAAALGLRTVCSYILPYLLYPAEDYGPFQSVTGVVSSVVTLALGALVSYLAGILPFRVLMIGACALSAFLILLEAVFTLLLKSILGDAPEPRRKKVSAWNTFRHPVFYTLMIPNLLRGFAFGTTTVFATVAFQLGFDQTLAANMLYLQSAAGLVGCALVGFLCKYFSGRYSVLLGSMSFLLLPLFFLRSRMLFLVVFIAVILGRTLVDYGVPILLRKAVPVELAGSYNAWRLILHNGGSLLATTVAAVIPLPALLTVTVVFSVISGAWFFLSGSIRSAETDPRIAERS